MEAWCLEHPWMTFFILMTFASSFSFVHITNKRKCNCKDE